MEALRWMFIIAIRFLGWILLKVEITNLDQLPASGPVILAMNHVNFLDVYLYTILPREMSTLAKEETWHNPVLRLLAIAWDAIPIRRGELDLNAIRLALQALRDSRVLTIAVEGTRSHHGRLQRGRPGIALLASRVPEVFIVPVAIYGGERFYGNLRRLRRTKINFLLGQGFFLDPGNGRVTRAVRQEIADEIMAQIASILPPENRGVYSDLAAATEHYLRFPPGATSNLGRVSGHTMSETASS